MTSKKGKPDQGRDAPAFQEYAASLMGSGRYRNLSASECGIFHRMRLACWVDGSVPSDIVKLSRTLSFDLEEVNKALPSLMFWFEIKSGKYVCTELDKYKAVIDWRKGQMSEGGKKNKGNLKQFKANPALVAEDNVSYWPEQPPATPVN